MFIWDIFSKKSLSFQFNLFVDNFTLDKTTAEELQNLLATLTEETGTEYVDAEKQEEVKDPNEFSFEWLGTHTIININDRDIIIRKMKIDDKTKIQTPEGEPITISMSSIGDIKIKRTFSIRGLLALMGCGAFFGLILSLFFGFKLFVIFLILGTVIGLLLSFPKALFIYLKDGRKYKAIVRGFKEYDRLISVLFK